MVISTGATTVFNCMADGIRTHEGCEGDRCFAKKIKLGADPAGSRPNAKQSKVFTLDGVPRRANYIIKQTLL